MFRGWFKKSPADNRDLESLIYDIAENQRNEDYVALYDRLQTTTLFLPVDADSLPARIAPGEKYVVTSADCIKMPLAFVPEIGDCAPIATHRNCRMLERGYVEVTWFDFLRLVARLPGSPGALLQGVRSWIVFDSGRVTYIMKKYSV